MWCITQLVRGHSYDLFWIIPQGVKRQGKMANVNGLITGFFDATAVLKIAD